MLKALFAVLSSVVFLSFVELGLVGCSTFKTNRSGREANGGASQADDSMVQESDSRGAGGFNGQGKLPVFPRVDVSKWSAMETSKTGVVFAWSLVGSNRLVSDAGCRLRLRHRESGGTVLLKVDPKVPVSVQSLKPGTWDAKRLGCGLTRVWDLDGLFREGFVVKADSVSVVGWFIFEFDDKTLVSVREGARSDNATLANQLRTGWPAGSNLISGFSGKTLPLQVAARDEIVRVKSSGLKNSEELLRPLLLRLQSCASAGMRVDPLRAGTLSIEASYKAGAFSGAKTSSAENALRDDLIQCLLVAHENFKPESTDDFKLTTTY